jgi:hypothetical protein
LPFFLPSLFPFCQQKIFWDQWSRGPLYFPPLIFALIAACNILYNYHVSSCNGPHAVFKKSYRAKIYLVFAKKPKR